MRRAVVQLQLKPARQPGETRLTWVGRSAGLTPTVPSLVVVPVVFTYMLRVERLLGWFLRVGCGHPPRQIQRAAE